MLFCILSTKVWLELSVNKWGACQHKWQREWAGGQSPPLTIKGEKQSKEAININKVLTIIDHSALCWWAMIAMGLNTWTHMINICRSFDEAANHEGFSFFFLFFFTKQTNVKCDGNCSAVQHPAASSLTVQQAVTSISLIWVRAKSASFARARTQPELKKYTLQRPGALCWVLSLLWDSGLLSRLKRPASGGPWR